MSSSSLPIDPSVISRCIGHLDRDEYDRALDSYVWMEKTSSVLLLLCRILSIISFTLCLLSTLLSIHAINSHRLPNRKHTVVISRCMCDIFTSVVIFISSLLSSQSSASFTLLALFIYLSTFGFVQLSLSHLLIILLRKLSLARPHSFTSFFTYRKLIISVLLVWIFSILYAAAFAPLTTVILSPELRQTVCSYSSCQKPLLVVCLCLLLFLLFLLLLSYSFVLINLKSIASERFHGESAPSNATFNRFLRFGSHIVLSAVVTVFLIIGISIILYNVWLSDKLTHYSDCRIVDYLSVTVRVEAVSGGGVILWIVRILADVVFLFLQEYRKLLPWITRKDEERSRLSENSSRQGRPLSSFNCPVFALDSSNRNIMKN